MGVEIHEDQPLVEPGAAWPRQIWIPMVLQGQYAGRIIYPPTLGTTNYANGLITIPLDFTALTNLYLHLFNTATADADIDIFIWFGQCGEIFNVHSQNINHKPAMVASTITCIDLVPLFAAHLANLVVGDDLWVSVQNNIATLIRVYGMDMRYT